MAMSEKAKESRRLYRQKNRTKLNEYQREWYKKHPGKQQEYQNRYWEKKYEELSEGNE